MANPIDYHIHSNRGDGIYSPKQLVAMTDATGITAAAITDQDDFSSYEEAQKEINDHPGQYSVKFTPGVEISTSFEGINCHLIGLHFNPNSPSMKKLVEDSKKFRVARTHAMIEHVKNQGVAIPDRTMEDILRNEKICSKRHLANMITATKLTDLNADVFRASYLDNMDVSRMKLPAPHVIGMIHGCPGAIVSLAHPITVAEENGLMNGELEMFIKKLADKGLDAIEAFSSRHDVAHKDYYYKLAGKFSLKTTAGSDFRGAKDGIMLGQIIKPDEPAAKAK